MAALARTGASVHPGTMTSSSPCSLLPTRLTRRDMVGGDLTPARGNPKALRAEKIRGRRQEKESKTPSRWVLAQGDV